MKERAIDDKYALRYTFDVYNVTNTTSFDIPQDNVTQNAGFNNAPDTAEFLQRGSSYTAAVPGEQRPCRYLL